MMIGGEKDDDHGLGLSLSLGCPSASSMSACRPNIAPSFISNNHHHQQPCLKLNLMSFPSHSTIQNNHHKMPFFNDLFRSSAPEMRNPDARSLKRRIDMNRVPVPLADCDDEAGMSSSPNSTISCSLSGKRSEREPGGEENEAERASCSRGSDDEDGADASRKKLRLSKEQALLLEETFKEHHTLNPKQKLALAKQLNLRPRQVEVWFQNRRARTKLKQTEVDCEYLKRCCENLTEENRRLQKEVQELRALKFSPQLYMHMNPPTTLTMCPSCERVAVSSSSSSTTTSSSAALAPKPPIIGHQHRTVPNPNHQPPVLPVNPWSAIPIRQRPVAETPNPPPSPRS